MSRPSSFVYTPAAVREIDRIAIEELGVPGFELMCRAGRLVWDVARERFPAARRWLVLCGAGNNAGDGYIIAALALEAGLPVVVAALSDPRRLGGDAARAWEKFERTGGTVVQFSDALCASADLIIDALLGTGLARNLEGAYLRAVESINGAAAPVIAVDVPSGLDGLSGRPLGAAVRADVTVTFIGRKQGLYLGAGPDHAGAVVFGSLGVPLERVGHVTPQFRLFDDGDRLHWLSHRARTAHKGDFGHVLLIGGNRGMGGSVRLAAEAALRAGAGLVSVATHPENVTAVIAGRPEVMCRGVVTPADLAPLLERATVIAVGPGLGQDAWARDLFGHVLGSQQPLVVDADALNLLADRPARRDDWVLTPHPGEAGRLLGVSAAEIQADRQRAAAQLCARYGGVSLLKGCGTIVACAAELPYLIDAGNPGMATGGMGDVLTGLVAGIAAQHRRGDLHAAAACAACVHASAADEAAQAGERGLVASDLFGPLRRWLNPPR